MASAPISPKKRQVGLKRQYFSIKKWASNKLHFRQQQTIYDRIIVRPVDLYRQFAFLLLTYFIWTLYYSWS